ncbi:guanylate cyclase [Leptospira kobayashii]|uniref:Guanylate cyclase n=1 Tax=Leptospira kobayashii TaxID=1917830 RepID=A0ABM7UQI6_9LEPT|nr:7TM diverse intracellular signaling domain-containing protein [Leptospira kobayashii]BDA77514.1 guanylate cyclase [Leptospira kobayashii]
MKFFLSKSFQIYFLSFVILFTMQVFAESTASIEWKKNTKTLPLSPKATYWEDKNKTETLSGILEKAKSGKDAKTADGKSLGFGYSSSAYWLHWSFEIAEGDEEELWLELVSLIDSIDLHLFYNGKEILTKHTGRILPFSSRLIEHRNFLFQLPFTKPGHYDLVMRFESQGSVLLPLTLWEKETYLEEEEAKTILFGAYFGVMGVVFFYNLFLFFSVKDRSYLYYIFYILFLTLIQSGIWGFTHAYVFPDLPTWADQTFPISIGLSCTFSMLFARKFVEAKNNMPKLNIYLTILACLSALVILPSFLGYYRLAVTLTLFFAVLNSLTLFGVSSYAWAKGYTQARFFLLGSSVVLVGAIVVGLRNFGILPYHFLTNYSLQIGSVLEAVFLSLSLADRINIVQREKVEIQTRSLEEQKSLAEAFSRFFPSQIIPLLNKSDVRDVFLGDAVDGEVAVLFLDIRGFTSISEKLNPRLTFDFLNAFMRFTAPSIERKSGYIDKYIGDSIMAFFPNSSENALAAAKDMMIGLEEFNRKREETGETPVKIGIGIHYGKVLIGTIGQESRMDGTLIGDTVNTASRLEGKTKELGTTVLLSETAYDKLSSESKASLKSLGELELRGREEKIAVYGLT